MADEVTFDDKDKDLPSSDPRKQFRDQDANELKDVINQHAEELNALTVGAPGPLNTLSEIAAAITALQVALAAHTGSSSNPHSVTKAQVGLSDVDNTSDLAKPISNATQVALNTKMARTDYAVGIAVVGTKNGSNLVFTIAQTIVSGSAEVFRNGQRLSEGIGYTIAYPSNVATITFAVPAPESDEDLKVNYIRP